MFQRLIEDLCKTGMGEADIALQIGVSQPTVNRLRRGRILDPKHSVGDALRRLHRDRISSARRAA